jgi:hypothetical protein
VDIDPGEVPEPYVAWLRAAAERAVQAHPGPVGELLARELCAYAEFGHRFGADGLLDRLAADLLDTQPPRHATRPDGGRAHLTVLRPSAP